MQFTEYLEQHHPEYEIDESWKSWAGGAALGAAGLGAALGGYQGLQPSQAPQQQPHTQQVQQVQSQDSDYEQLYQQYYNKYAKVFDGAKAKEMAHKLATSQLKKQQLQNAGKTSGTFKQGQLQQQSGGGGGIQNQSVTSPDAGSFL